MTGRHTGRIVLATSTIAGLTALGAGFWLFATTIETTERLPVRHADGIVALTGGSERLSDAVTLLSRGHAGRLLITGVNAATTRDDLARRIPNASLLVDCCVDLDYRAVDTVGNARETAAWVRANGLRSLIVVTSNYHMPRALAEITVRLPGVDVQSYSVVSDRKFAQGWTGRARLARLMLGEYCKYLWVRAHNALWPPAPDETGLAIARSSP